MIRYQTLSLGAVWSCRVICAVVLFLSCGCNEDQPYPKKALSFSTSLEGNSCCAGISYRDAPGGQLLSFRKVGSSWKLDQQIDLLDYGRHLRSGISLGFNDRYLCTGADAPKTKPGKVLLFGKEDRGWKFVRSIAAPKGDQTENMSNLFGSALAMSGNNHLFCGAPWARTNGLVYVFEIGRDSVKMIHKIEPVHSTEYAYFGGSVAFSDGTLVIGANSVKNIGQSSSPSSKTVGGAYIFEFRSGSWVSVQSLQDSLIQQGVSFLEFGTHVDIDGEDVVVTDRRSAHVFTRNRLGRWEYVRAIKAKQGGVAAVSLVDGLLAVSLDHDVCVYRRDESKKWNKVSVIPKDPKAATTVSLATDGGMSLLVGASDMYAFSEFEGSAGNTQARLALYNLQGSSQEEVFEIRYLESGVQKSGLK